MYVYMYLKWIVCIYTNMYISTYVHIFIQVVCFVVLRGGRMTSHNLITVSLVFKAFPRRLRVYLHMYIYIHAYANIYTHTYIHTCMHSYIYTYIHTYMHIYTYHTHIDMSMHSGMCLFCFVFLCLCVYLNTHT